MLARVCLWSKESFGSVESEGDLRWNCFVGDLGRRFVGMLVCVSFCNMWMLHLRWRCRRDASIGAKVVTQICGVGCNGRILRGNGNGS